MLSRFIVLLFGLSVVSAQHYTIETVVAVDDGMVDYYGDELWGVVMTAMNLTSDVYEKSNLDQSISVSVLQLIQLPFPSSDFEDAPGTNGKDSQAMLTKFCEYMQSTSMKYDAAILITRTGIYNTAFNPPSGINGLSNVGAMCGPNACLILSDSFIITNWVAAHELGHTFGANHDDEADCADFPKADGPTIMTAAVGQSWNFSPCSQSAVDERIEKTTCLTEQLGPNLLDNLYKYPELFYFSRQCKEWLQDRFNEDAPFKKETDNCKQMWCPIKGGSNYSNMAPWANGTPCGKNKVCQYLKCVDE